MELTTDLVAGRREAGVGGVVTRGAVAAGGAGTRLAPRPLPVMTRDTSQMTRDTSQVTRYDT